MSKKHKQHDSAEARPAATAASGIIDKFEALGNHGIWVVLGIAMLMIAFVYWDFITAAKVLLYKDIGSDSINIFYPMYKQAALMWERYGSTTGYSLHSTMGHQVGFSPLDIFSWIIALGGTSNVASNIVYAEMLKVLLSVGLGYFFFRYQSLSNLSSSIGALCLGFSGFLILASAGWYAQSLEAVYFALAIWAIEYALQRKPFFYVIAPAAFAIVVQTSGYFAIYVIATLIAYVGFKTVLAINRRESLTSGPIAIGLVFVGLALSYQSVQSTLDLIRNSGRAESIRQTKAISVYGTNMDVGMFDLAPKSDYTNIVLRAYNNNMMGTGNGFKGMMNYLEAPLLYYGLAMLFFTPFLFVRQTARMRLAYGALAGIALMMLVFPWFRFAFWNFQLDYFREFTMLLGFVFLYLSILGFEQFKNTNSGRFKIVAPVVSFIVLLLPSLASNPAIPVDNATKTAVTALVIGLSISTIAFAFTRNALFLAGVLALTIVDLSVNANTTVSKRDLLTTREIEQGLLYGGPSQKAIDWINGRDENLFRVVKFASAGPTIHTSLNDAMVQGFNGIVGYSSFHNKYYLRAMEAFGCRDASNPNEAKWVAKAITRPYLASALGVKYFLVNDKPMGFNDAYFPTIKQADNVFVHESKVALPLLVAYDSYITEDEFRTQTNGRNDYMLYKAVVVDPAACNVGQSPHYNLAADTLRSVGPLDVARAAEERKWLMTVAAKTTQTGITANVDLKRDALVVINIPYDESMQVTVDGQPANTFVANFGFVGVKVTAGKRMISTTR